MASKKSVLSAAIGTAFVAGLTAAPQIFAQDNPFEMQSLKSGYQVADNKAKEAKCGGDKAKEAKCGGDKAKDGKCGGDKAKDGKCGGDKKKDGKCGEGKCGGAK